ncbi:DUF3325 domain-containing protein [Variovorax sp. UMC13]|uniref:DUF3325 domain-containing protein n=1 Tax=Variovorax sp. UMC13 TaxID=1862326 RepID=UPI001603423D|nr:DUF3325 domain-containing protein [Variovorax sp. UMC13]MBB1602306.1 hypothetical protein [Variovorax sp. UMC13]
MNGWFHGLAFVLCLPGFAALALAMERHQEELFAHAFAPSLTRRLRVAGWSALLLALGVLVGAQGWGLGLVSFSGHTSLAAGLVFVALLLQGRRKA